MKNNWKILAIVIAVSIITPIIIGFGVSQDILNDWTNDNDWIGFWGSYVGTLIGSGITLLVLWSTLEDNKHAREREEKLSYYNNLIETIATYLADADNYLASLTRLLNKQDYESRNKYVQAKNHLTKSSTILSTQLYIKNGIQNVDKIIECIESIDNMLHDMGVDTNKIARERFENRKSINDLKNRIDVVIKEMNEFLELFPELIKEELEK